MPYVFTPQSSIRNDINFIEVNQEKLTIIPMPSFKKPDESEDHDLKLKARSVPTKDTGGIKSPINLG